MCLLHGLEPIAGNGVMNGCGEKNKSSPEDIDLLYCQSKLIWLYMNRSGRYKTIRVYSSRLIMSHTIL